MNGKKNQWLPSVSGKKNSWLQRGYTENFHCDETVLYGTEVLDKLLCTFSKTHRTTYCKEWT